VIEKHPLRSQSDAALRATPCHAASFVASLAPRALAAATTSDWKLRTIPWQAFALAAVELEAALFEAPAAVPLIASAAKPRSAAIVPLRPVAMLMVNLLWGRDASGRERLIGGERRLLPFGAIHPLSLPTLATAALTSP
jgi:hypothetical protein